MASRTPYHPLRSPPFLWFWVGQTASLVGDRVYGVALPFLVLELGGDGERLGQILAAYTVPQVVFLVLGGVLVDRMPRRATMIASDGFHVVLLAILILLLLEERLVLTHLYVFSAFFGLASAFFLPATTSIVPELVPREALARANALRAFATELSGIVGPPLGGVLVSLGGLSVALGLDALSFLVGALCLFAVRARPKASGGSARRPYLEDLVEGFRYVAGTGWLWITIVVFSVVNVFTSGTTAILLPLLAAERFDGAVSLGWMLAGLASGALVASVALQRASVGRRRGVLAYAAVAGAGLGTMAAAVAPQVWLAAVALAWVGGCMTVFGVLWETALQERVPAEALGRVASMDMLGSFALMPLGFLATGLLVEEAASTTGIVAAYGASTIVLALAGLAIPTGRTWD